MLAYSFTVSLLLAKVVHATIGLRVSAEAEIIGVDQTEHAETAYDGGALSGTPPYRIAPAPLPYIRR